MKLTRRDEEMLEGCHGPPGNAAIEGLVTLGKAYDAPDTLDTGYAHIHAGMAMVGVVAIWLHRPRPRRRTLLTRLGHRHDRGAGQARPTARRLCDGLAARDRRRLGRPAGAAHHVVVADTHWLTDQQFKEIYSPGRVAPGPNMTMVAVIGVHVAGRAGALVTLVACRPALSRSV